MTTEERFDSIENLTAGISEERRKDREEYKSLWARVLQMSEETQEADSRLEARITQLAEESRTSITQLAQESRAANKLLEERIASLVSGFGEFMRQMPKPKE